MAIENGDFVRLNFTSKVKETDEVFDTTFEEVAKEAEILLKDKVYEPLAFVVGANHFLSGVEEAIIGLEVGDSKHFEISCEDAFGSRNPNLIQLIPMKNFKKQGMTPYPGMKFSSEGSIGKVLTVNGGRVRVDFNHDLAGKDLVYDIEVVEIIEDDIEKVKSLIKLYYSYPDMDLDKAEIEIKDDVCNIKLEEPSKLDNRAYVNINAIRFAISKEIWNIMGIDKVNFIDAFEKENYKLDSEESSEEGSKEDFEEGSKEYSEESSEEGSKEDFEEGSEEVKEE